MHRHVPLTLPGTMAGVRLDGTKVGDKRMTLPRARFLGNENHFEKLVNCHGKNELISCLCNRHIRDSPDGLGV